MTNLEKARIILEAVEDDATPGQIANVLWQIITYLEENKSIGFTNEGK